MSGPIRSRLDALQREVRRAIAGNARSFGQLAGPVASPRQALAFPAKYLAAQRIGDETLAANRGHNNAGDARRHAELSRRMTAEIGPVSSALIGVGHEIEGALLGQPFSEARMDMTNNAEGLRAGLAGRQPDPARLQTSAGPPAASRRGR